MSKESKIALQFIRFKDDQFEIVTWVKPKFHVPVYDILVERIRPTMEQMERVKRLGSCIIVDNFSGVKPSKIR